MCTCGVLSLTGTDVAPYGVPVSYATDGAGHIYIHSARNGRKLDCIAANAECSFCVVAQDKIVPDEFTSYFRSVIAEGRIAVVSDREEIHKGLLLLCDKYSPGIDPTEEIARCLAHVCVLRIDIESLSGKESIELVRAKDARSAG
ncbi:MAG: pyridoxamine 5'-phosphate oxidase family protein [Bacteroides sp.]|nr:pyridoxamine 5'-phosphate oxidase family protein [Bacteroides sp.]MCM1095002.1 pyridoxamine 5'-phosphate oxidase family protein [Terasakiella sp.]